MVYSEEQRRERNEEEEEDEDVISMAREEEEEEEEEEERVSPKPKPPLYNFNQPFLLKWGHQKQLRCIKLDHHHHHHNTNTSTGFHSSGDRSHRFHGRRTIKNHRSSSSSSSGVRVQDFRQEFKIPRQRVVVTSSAAAAAAAAVGDEVEEGIDAVRERLVFDLKKEADMMKHAIFKSDVSDDDDEVAVEHDDERFRPVVVGVAAAGSMEQEAARPWNLRTRRTAGKASPAVNEGVKPSRTRVGREAHKEERAKFSVGLMRKEIEDDFMAMVGHRPPRRPKKRPRNVQKELDVSSVDG